MKVALPEIRHSLEGFQALVGLYAQTNDRFFEEIQIDMRRASWFDADMCAAFGAILYRLGENVNSISLEGIPADVERILSRNGFLSNYGREKIPDTWGTTIPYQRYDAKDDRYFADYIEKKFIHRSEMPKMSVGLVKKFRESVFEIFGNAVIHSRTELGIFSCGQFFPKRCKLDFSVADLGVGIRKNVEDNLGLDLSAEDAIDWATQGTNTTKRGRIPGGLGLKLLTEFIRLNGGRLQIVSDRGYWCLEQESPRKASLMGSFPGTVVNIEINTSDVRSYRLKSELSETDVF
ncbi:MAG: ATP-binding protein [Pseudomonadota bacterium]